MIIKYKSQTLAPIFITFIPHHHFLYKANKYFPQQY
jgi:hypothetical protein